VLIWPGSNKGEVKAIHKVQEAIDMAQEVPGGTRERNIHSNGCNQGNIGTSGL